MLTRHGESTLNSENRINGNPDVPVALTEKGRDEARLLGQQIAHIRLDVCICTRFTRTRETAEIALAGPGCSDRDRAAPRRHRRRQPRGTLDRGLPRLEARAHAPGSVSGRGVARRRGTTLCAGLPQATRTTRDIGARGHPRDSRALCDQRRRRLRRPRRAGPSAGERDALPLRQGSPRPCRGGHRAARRRIGFRAIPTAKGAT